MITIFFRASLILAICFILKELDYISIMWWLIPGITVLELLIPRWKRWTRTNPLVSPEQSLRRIAALVKIRSVEIGALYHSVRSYQKQAQNCSWIPLFMGEYRYQTNQGLYDDTCEKKQQN